MLLIFTVISFLVPINIFAGTPQRNQSQIRSETPQVRESPEPIQEVHLLQTLRKASTTRRNCSVMLKKNNKNDPLVITLIYS